jgi:hypothetical protein
MSMVYVCTAKVANFRVANEDQCNARDRELRPNKKLVLPNSASASSVRILKAV